VNNEQCQSDPSSFQSMVDVSLIFDSLLVAEFASKVSEFVPSPSDKFLALIPKQ